LAVLAFEGEPAQLQLSAAKYFEDFGGVVALVGV
jgi:hypothetical protein